ncbi:MAG: hypothetical protein N3A38_01680, partial [Planctomycetota bacterium]|nr:hypothetical protein [Planctomycetota bacterium]
MQDFRAAGVVLARPAAAGVARAPGGARAAIGAAVSAWAPVLLFAAQGGWYAHSCLGNAALADEWEGPKLKPVAREEVFEFARKPEFRRVGKDRYEITFATKGRCDVAVAIEDGAGRIVRHIAYGVLGPNAPEPLRPDSLEQTLAWDGKDDFRRYVEEPEKCVARVSLGLKPVFDKVLGWHPKDVIGDITGLAAGPEGVVVITGGGYWQSVRLFSHDGGYIRTLMPPPADKLGAIEGLTGGLMPVPGQEPGVPRRTRYGIIAPFAFGGRAVSSNPAVISNGRVAIAIHGGQLPKQIVRIGTDGTSRGESVSGPVLADSRENFDGGGEMAASPDGKYLYITAMGANAEYDGRGRLRDLNFPKRDPRHAVFRVEWNQKEKLDWNQPFAGEVGRPPYSRNKSYYGDDDRHLDTPCGIACDSQGRVYVSDYGNNRIQVFKPDGAPAASIKVQRPRQLAIHHKTGEIYLLSYDWGYRDIQFVKLSPLPDSKEMFRAPLTVKIGDTGPGHDLGDFKSMWMQAGFQMLFCLDSWADPPRIWLTLGKQRLTRWVEKGKGFEQEEDFEQTVTGDGYLPHAYNGYKMNRIHVDHIRGDLYYVNSLSGTILKMPAGEEKKWLRVFLGHRAGCDEMAMGWDGLMYVRTVQWLVRFDPSSPQPADGHRKKEADLVIEMDREVPFDYGEEQLIPWTGGRKFRGVLKLPAQIPGNGFDQGMSVTPRGDVLALCKNFHQIADRFESKGTTIPPLESDRYRPKIFPGRKWDCAELVFRWDNRGEMTGEDLIAAGAGSTACIKGDRWGNIYIGLSAHQVGPDGKPCVPTHSGDTHGIGAVLKFPPSGGKIYGTWGTPAVLKEIPNRPHEYEVGGEKLWTKNLLWSYP